MGTRPWDGLVPEADLRALEGRGRPLDRRPRFTARPCLVLVDMTRAFVEPGYPVSCTGGVDAARAAAEVLAAARAAAVPVVFTRIAAHGPGGGFLPADLGLGATAELLATPAGLPDGNTITDLLAPRDGEAVLAKPRASAFFGTPLDTHLNHLGVDGLIVTGLVTSGCVRATVVDAQMRSYPVVLVEEAVADYSDFQHRAALLDMHAKYADLATTSDVVGHLRERPS